MPVSEPIQGDLGSSPFISADELRRRLNATRDAFNRSLEANSIRKPVFTPSKIEDLSFEAHKVSHVPVDFNDEDEALLRRFDTLEQLSPVNLRRSSSQLDLLKAELENIKRADEQKKPLKAKASGFLTFASLMVLMVAYVSYLAYLAYLTYSPMFSLKTAIQILENLMNFYLFN